MGSLANPQPDTDFGPFGVAVISTMDGEEFFFGPPAEETPPPNSDVQPEPEYIPAFAA